MRGRFVLVLALATACNALTGVNDFTVDDDIDGSAPVPAPTSSSSSSSSTTSTSSASSSSSSSSSSGGSTSSSSSTSSTSSSSSSSSTSSTSSSGGTTSPVVLIDEHFPSSCEGWTGENTSAIVARPDTGHTANGSCELCGLNPGDFYITKTVTAPRAGKLSAEMYVESANNPGATGTASMVIQAAGTSISGSKSIGATFTLFTSGTATVASGAAITLKIGVSAAPAGQCIVVDDIVLTLN